MSAHTRGNFFVPLVMMGQLFMYVWLLYLLSDQLWHKLACDLRNKILMFHTKGDLILKN